MLHGAVVLKPSSEFNALYTPACDAGVPAAIGMFRVRSVEPWRSRSIGNGTVPEVGSNLAVVCSGTGAV